MNPWHANPINFCHPTLWNIDLLLIDQLLWHNIERLTWNVLNFLKLNNFLNELTLSSISIIYFTLLHLSHLVWLLFIIFVFFFLLHCRHIISFGYYTFATELINFCFLFVFILFFCILLVYMLKQLLFGPFELFWFVVLKCRWWCFSFRFVKES